MPNNRLLARCNAFSTRRRRRSGIKKHKFSIRVSIKKCAKKYRFGELRVSTSIKKMEILFAKLPTNVLDLTKVVCQCFHNYECDFFKFRMLIISPIMGNGYKCTDVILTSC